MPLVLAKFGSIRFGKRSLRYIRRCLLWNNLENSFKISKSAKEFRGQILRWDGPAC